MANLYLIEQNSILRKTGDRLIVQKQDEILLDVQCHKIDAVLIFGNVQFTTQAVHELFEHGIEDGYSFAKGKAHRPDNFSSYEKYHFTCSTV